MELIHSMRPGPINPLRSPPPPYVLPAAPTPPTPAPRKELTGTGSLPATTDARVVEQMLGLVPGRWDGATNRIIYDWVKQNPRIAFLFWWCDDIAAWPKAGIFTLPPLEDSMLPFQESDLDRIAFNPRKVIENQWRVMTKELIPNGQHTDFRSFETVPLQSVATMTSSELGAVERVRWYGQQDDRVYVRKSYTFQRSDQKDRILTKMQFFKRLDNSHIAKILCSYQQGNQIAFVTLPAICNLDEYLHHAAAQDPSRQELLLTWINDLTQALAYIHSSGKVYAHRDIRPRKILITSSFRIMFSVFGIAPSGTLGSSQTLDSGVTTSSGAGGSERYIYAAPEVIQRREQPSRPADVFALGCVLLNLMTVFRGQSLKTFLAYRMAQSATRGDPSFHANRDAVRAWTEKLKGVNSFVAGQWKSERERAVENKVFAFIGDMLVAEPGKRIEMKKLSSRVDGWNEGRMLARRRSLDGMERYATDMQGLERYYAAR